MGKNFFIETGISVTSAKLYVQIFASEKFTKDSLPMLDHSVLKESGIRTMGEILALLKLGKELYAPCRTLPAHGGGEQRKVGMRGEDYLH